MLKSENNMTKKEKLDELYNRVKDCNNCRLGAVRDKLVFGEGNPEADIFFIGEGPGKEENIQGRPFVGRAGELLTAIIEKGMSLTREDVYIGNIVKCRPTLNLEGNRDRPPEKDEVAACSWILEKQIEIINPKIIITLGNPATKFILNTTTGITKMRGKIGEYNGIKVMPTYHPSYIIRQGGINSKSQAKRDCWEDIKTVLEYLKMPIPGNN